MIGLIGLIAIVYWIGTRYGDHAGVIATGAAVLFLIVLFCSAWSDHVNAVHNWVRYWKRGGPEGERGRVRYRKKVVHGCGLYDMRPSEPSVRERIEAAKRRAAYAESMRTGEVKAPRSGPARVCHYCGRFVYAGGQRVVTSEGIATVYTCPRCGRVNVTRLGA